MDLFRINMYKELVICWHFWNLGHTTVFYPFHTSLPSSYIPYFLNPFLNTYIQDIEALNTFICNIFTLLTYSYLHRM